MSERPSFSPFWHRVRLLKPRLRPHVQITRQHYRGKRWHVVHDPSSNQFYRLNHVAHEFVGLFDGRRTVEEIWQIGLTRHADESLTQNEALQLIGQLYGANLLAVDASPEAEQLLRRGRERLGKKMKQQAIGLMYFRVRLFNPDRILRWLEPIARPLINRVGLVLWVVWVIAALVAVLPHWEELVAGVDSAIAPSNWAWILVIFVALKLFHETGHGLICRRFGGQVPEFGAMMLVLVPAPYVDASASWTFESKWKRIAVGAGGMIFELALAAGAAFVWLNTRDNSGSLLHQLAYNAMFTASLSTVLFNANPLMKFDGYYILSDLLEVPNLMQRSTGMLKFLFEKHVYRVRDARPTTSSMSEAWILIVYGLLVLAYRIFLFLSITLYVMGQLFFIGLFLAAWTAAMWFILPVGQFIHWLATSPKLAEFRPRAILTSILMIGAVLLAVGAVPAPDRRRAMGVIESYDRTGVYFRVDAFVAEAHVRPGDWVEEGQPLVTCESARLDAEVHLAQAQLDEARSREAQATAQNPAAAQVAREFVRTLSERMTTLRERQERLIVRAPHRGRIVGQNPQLLVGSFVREGDNACAVIDDTQLRIVATIGQTEASWVFGPPDQYEGYLRSLADVSRVVPVRFERQVESGRRELPHPAVGYAGGGDVEIDRTDQTGTLAKRPMFRAYFVPEIEPGEKPVGFPGERVVLRFTLESRPLLMQWLDRLAKLTQGRAKV